MVTSTRFAGYPSAVVYKNPDGTKPIQHLIWGDWLRLGSGRNGDYREVHARGEDYSYRGMQYTRKKVRQISCLQATRAKVK